MGLARAENQGLMPLPEIVPKGWDTVLCHDTFEDGLGGWHTQNNSFPPCLSDHGFNGSPWAMKLGTGVGFSTDFGGSSSIYKRLARTFEDGYVLHAAWIAFRGPSEHASPGSITISMDHQNLDDTGRSFSRMRLRRFSGPANAYLPQWSLTPDQIPVLPPANTFQDIPGARAAAYPPVAGTGGGVPGWNVGHAGYFFVGLLVNCNMADKAVGQPGLGTYWRAYLGHKAYDLSTLATNNTLTGPGSGAENPQTDTAAGGPNSASSFSAGLNIGYSIANGPGGEGPAELLVGAAMAVHYPANADVADTVLFPVGG